MSHHDEAVTVCEAVFECVEQLSKGKVTCPAALLHGTAAALGNSIALMATEEAREAVLATALATVIQACRGRALRDGPVAGQA